MQRLSRQFFFVGGLALIASSTPVVGEVAESEPALHYSVDVGFAYVNRFSRPALSVIQTEPVDSTSEDNADQDHYRSLGLTDMRIGLDWISFQGADFHAVLRPDALTRSADDEGLVREFDSRAGSLYRPQARPLKFLDTYHLRLAAGNSFATRLGVFDRIAPPVGAYPALLDFGLRVRMPAKYAGMEIGWRNFSQANQTDTRKTGLSFDFVVFQGDEDRNEEFVYRPEAYDRAPEAQDPYYGGALRTRWIPTPAMTLGLLGGSHDTKLSDGKHTETFFRLFSEVVFDYLAMMPKVALEFRYASEKWRTEQIEIADKVQQNVSLTTNLKVGARTWTVLGFHMGRSDRQKTGEIDKILPANGYQVDLGVIGKVDRQLNWQVMMNEERREIEGLDGETEGGFVNESGSRRTLRRLAFGLRYLLDANG